MSIDTEYSGPPIAGPFKTLEEALAAAMQLSKDNPNSRIIIPNKDGTTVVGKA